MTAPPDFAPQTRTQRSLWDWVGVIFAVLLVVQAFSSAQAAQLTYPGPAPCDTTLQACIQASAAGDTIDIATDTPIDEQLFINRSLTLRAAPGFTPVIGGSTALRGIDFGGLGQPGLSGDNQKVIVEGLFFDYARLTGVVRFGTGHEIILRNNQFDFELDNNNTAAIDLRIQAPTRVLVERNRIVSTGQGVRVQAEGESAAAEFIGNRVTTSLPAESNSGLSFRLEGTGTYQVKAVNNVIYSVAGCSCGNASGIDVWVPEAAEVDAVVAHNTLHDIQGGGDGIDVWVDDPGANLTLFIFNNTVSRARQRGYQIDLGGASALLTAAGNNSFNNGQPEVGFPGELTRFDPRFVDVSKADFRLRKESFLIDAGQPNLALGSFSLDAAGAARPSGAMVDVGAHEFGAEAPLLMTRRATFESAAAAQVVSAPYPNNSGPGQPFVSGQITFDTMAPSSLNFGTWPADFPEDNNIELALNDAENLFIRSNVGAVRGIGIEFDDASGGSSPSTFEVAMLLQGVELGRLSFRTPGFADQDFVGLWTHAEFDELRILERPNANQNEYFGRVFFSRIAPPPGRFADGLEGPCPADDDWEPNDSPAGATLVNTPFLRDDFVLCSGDEDFFRFSAEERDTIIVDIDFAHAEGNIDFELRDEAGIVVLSRSSNSDNEVGAYPLPPGRAGEYTLRVYGEGPVQNRYRLFVVTD